MNDLIEALQIFAKYQNHKWPTYCEHDVLYVVGITPETVSQEDLRRLSELGFLPNDDCDGFESFRFGSA